MSIKLKIQLKYVKVSMRRRSRGGNSRYIRALKGKILSFASASGERRTAVLDEITASLIEKPEILRFCINDLINISKMDVVADLLESLLGANSTRLLDTLNSCEPSPASIGKEASSEVLDTYVAIRWRRARKSNRPYVSPEYFMDCTDRIRNALERMDYGINSQQDLERFAGVRRF